jgi:hypothetical protein
MTVTKMLPQPVDEGVKGGCEARERREENENDAWDEAQVHLRRKKSPLVLSQEKHESERLRGAASKSLVEQIEFWIQTPSAMSTPSEHFLREA